MEPENAETHDEGGSSGESGDLFTGSFPYALDAKGRVVLPPSFRRALGRAGVITRMPGGCLVLLSEEDFHVRAERIEERQRRGDLELKAARVFFWNAHPVKIDNAGRIAIPAGLRSWAELDRDVVVAGSGRRIEIWSKARYDEQEAAMAESYKSGEGLSDGGFF